MEGTSEERKEVKQTENTAESENGDEDEPMSTLGECEEEEEEDSTRPATAASGISPSDVSEEGNSIDEV